MQSTNEANTSIDGAPVSRGAETNVCVQQDARNDRTVDERFVIVIESNVKHTSPSTIFSNTVTMMSNIKQKLIDFCSSRKSLLKCALYGVIIVLCLVYTALSVWYHFGDEDSATVLCVSGIGVAIMTMRIWKHRNSRMAGDTKLDSDHGVLKKHIKQVVALFYKHSNTINRLVRHYLLIKYIHLLSVELHSYRLRLLPQKLNVVITTVFYPGLVRNLSAVHN